MYLAVIFPFFKHCLSFVDLYCPDIILHSNSSKKLSKEPRCWGQLARTSKQWQWWPQQGHWNFVKRAYHWQVWVDNSYLTAYSETFLPCLFSVFWGWRTGWAAFISSSFAELSGNMEAHWGWTRKHLDYSSKEAAMLRQAMWTGDRIACNKWARMSLVSYSGGLLGGWNGGFP